MLLWGNFTLLPNRPVRWWKVVGILTILTPWAIALAAYKLRGN